MSVSNKKRVCVIGCGPSGMSLLLHLGKFPNEEIPDIVCYEKQDTIGGMWNLTWRTGLDQYSEPLHPSMYYGLWINNPHCINEYPDYTYKEHFGKELPTYFPGTVVRHYIEGRFVNGSKRDLKQFVRFSTVVRRVNYNKDTDDFTVIVKNLKTNKEDIERFTHVVVATGKFATPFYPEIPGIEDFKGRVLHAKQVKHLNEFKGQRVLIIGSRWSAEDLALMLVKYGSGQVNIAYNNRPPCRKWPDGIVERRQAVKVDETKAYFEDGTDAEIDVVMICTGYKLDFPFMSEELTLNPECLLYPENLYEGVLWLKGGNHKLMYFGMQYNPFGFILGECQSIWACQYITGKLRLPSKAEMNADSMNWVEKANHAAKNPNFQEMFEFIKEYFRHMVNTAGYSTVVLELPNMLHRMFEDIAENMATWRDQQFTCIYTGNTGKAPIVPWMDNFDDSVESIVKQC